MNYDGSPVMFVLRIVSTHKVHSSNKIMILAVAGCTVHSSGCSGPNIKITTRNPRAVITREEDRTGTASLCPLVLVLSGKS